MRARFFLSICASASLALGCSVNSLDVLAANQGGAAGASGAGGAGAGNAGSAGGAGKSGPGGSAGRAGAAGEGAAGAVSGQGGAGRGGNGVAGSSGAAGADAIAGSSGMAGSGGPAGASGVAGNGGAAGASGGGGAAGSEAMGGADAGGTAGAGGAAGVGGAETGGAAGLGGQAGGGGKGEEPCPTLHVSPLGSDANSGCSEALPLRSPSAALAIANAQNPVLAKSIKICAGAYDEAATLSLQVGVSIRGSYACGSSPWIEPSESSKPVPTTVIQGSASPLLLLEGAALDASVIVSDLRLQPPTGQMQGMTPGVGVVFGNGARPTFRRNEVRAPKGSGGAFGSAAAIIDTGAQPDIASCKLEGGDGLLLDQSDVPPTSILAGSLGLYVAADAGSVTLRDTTVQAGVGASEAQRPGSVGVLSRGTDLTVEGGSVFGGTGALLAKNNALGAPAAIGIDASGAVKTAKLQLRGTTVNGGNANVKAPGSTVGVLVNEQSAAIRGCRIYGGDPPKPAVALSAVVAVAMVTTRSDVDVQNSVLHGGGLEPASAGARTDFTRALIAFGGKLEGSHLTMMPGAGEANAAGVHVADAEVKLDLRSSLMVSERPLTIAFVVTGGACDAPSQARITLDRFVVAQPTLAELTGNDALLTGDAACPRTKDVAQLPTPLFSHDRLRLLVGAKTGNATHLTMESCSTNEQCAGQLLGNYSLGQGAFPVLGGNGLALRCIGTPVQLRAGGQGALTNEDILGQARTTQPSLGAFEASCKEGGAPGW